MLSAISFAHWAATNLIAKYLDIKQLIFSKFDGFFKEYISFSWASVDVGIAIGVGGKGGNS